MSLQNTAVEIEMHVHQVEQLVGSVKPRKSRFSSAQETFYSAARFS
jgi:hypothetical protein